MCPATVSARRKIESALVLHEAVAEAAVVGYPHPVKGQGIYAYVTLMRDAAPSAELRQALTRHVRAEIGPIASPDLIQWAPGLPKTRSGKIMRRILRKVAANELDNLGDTSTLAEPAVVEDLVANRANRLEASLRMAASQREARPPDPEQVGEVWRQACLDYWGDLSRAAIPRG